MSLITQELETAVKDSNQAPDPSLVVKRFDIFIICIRVNDGRVAVTRGLEQLATASAWCMYRTFHRLTVTDPTSSALEDLRRRYCEVFIDGTNFTDLSFRHTMIAIRALIKGDQNPRPIWHDGDRPSDHDHILFARDISELSQVEYQRQKKVPDWILGFSFDSLSLAPLPSAAIVADCLKVIAIGLGCDVSGIMALEKRYMCLDFTGIYILTRISAQVENLSTLITRELETTVEDGDRALVITRFNIFATCIRVSNGKVAIEQGLGKLATVSTQCIYHTLHRLTAINSTSSVLEDMRRRCRRVLPYWIDFAGSVPSRHTIIMIHALIKEDWSPRPIWRDDYRPSDHDHILFARDITELAQVEYQWQQKVPSWILGFSFDSLSLDPLPSVAVVADCLKVIGISLGCDVSGIVAPEKRYIF